MTANVTFVRHDGDPVAVSFGSWVDDRGIEGPQATPYAHHVVISTWIGMSSILDQPQIAHRREKYVGGPAKILEALHEKEKKRKRVKEGTIDYQQHDPFSRSTCNSQTSHLPFRIKEIELCCFPINAVFSSRFSCVFSLTTIYFVPSSIPTTLLLRKYRYPQHCLFARCCHYTVSYPIEFSISFEGHPLKMKFSTIPTVLLTVLAASAKAQVFYNTTTYRLECPSGRRAFCDDYMPLSTNIIIRCYGRRAVPANCNDNLAGIYPIGVKNSAKCFDSLNGVVACYYNGFVYPDGGNPFQLPAAFAQYLSDFNANATNTSTISTTSESSQSGRSPAMPTARPTGVPIAPGSGGYYNLTTVTGSGLATLTEVFSPPRPTTPFISAASSLTMCMYTGMLFGILTWISIFVVLWLST